MKYFKWVFVNGRGVSKWVWIFSTVIGVLSTVELLGLSIWAYLVYFGSDVPIAILKIVVGLAALGLTLFFSAFYGYIFTDDNFHYAFWDSQIARGKEI